MFEENTIRTGLHEDIEGLLERGAGEPVKGERGGEHPESGILDKRLIYVA